MTIYTKNLGSLLTLLHAVALFDLRSTVAGFHCLGWWKGSGVAGVWRRIVTDVDKSNYIFLFTLRLLDRDSFLGKRLVHGLIVRNVRIIRSFLVSSTLASRNKRH